AEPVRGGDGAGGEAAQAGPVEVRVEVGRGEGGEEDAAHGGAVRGEAGADADGHAHDAGGGDAGHVHDVLAVEHGDGGRFVHLGGEAFEVGGGDLGQREAGQVGVAEFEYAGGEGEQPPVAAHVPEVGEGEQEAAGGGAGEAGGAGDVAEGQPGGAGGEGADHGEAAGQRLHVFDHGSGASGRMFGTRMSVRMANGRVVGVVRPVTLIRLPVVPRSGQRPPEPASGVLTLRCLHHVG